MSVVLLILRKILLVFRRSPRTSRMNVRDDARRCILSGRSGPRFYRAQDTPVWVRAKDIPRTFAAPVKAVNLLRIESRINVAAELPESKEAIHTRVK
jgi:hypothetical protein